MTSIGSTIKKLRKSQGLTQQQLAEKVGASTYTTVSKWESDANYPQGRDLIILSKLFDVSVDHILGTKQIESSAQTFAYPFLPADVAAGLPENMNAVTLKDVDEMEIPDAVMGKWAGQKNVFLMRVNGQSMNRVIPDQSLIAVKPTDYCNLKNGDIVVFSDNHEYSVKRLYQHDNKLIFKPDSEDIRFTDYISSTDNPNLVIYGKAVVYIVNLD